MAVTIKHSINVKKAKDHVVATLRKNSLKEARQCLVDAERQCQNLYHDGVRGRSLSNVYELVAKHVNNARDSFRDVYPPDDVLLAIDNVKECLHQWRVEKSSENLKELLDALSAAVLSCVKSIEAEM